MYKKKNPCILGIIFHLRLCCKIKKWISYKNARTRGYNGNQANVFMRVMFGSVCACMRPPHPLRSVSRAGYRWEQTQSWFGSSVPSFWTARCWPPHPADRSVKSEKSKANASCKLIKTRYELWENRKWRLNHVERLYPITPTHPDENYVCRLDGHVGARANGDAQIGASESGRVVHPVTHHGHLHPLFLQLLHFRHLVRGQDLGKHFPDANLCQRVEM